MLLLIKTGNEIKYLVSFIDIISCSDIIFCDFIVFQVTRKTAGSCLYLSIIDLSYIFLISTYLNLVGYPSRSNRYWWGEGTRTPTPDSQGGGGGVWGGGHVHWEDRLVIQEFRYKMIDRGNVQVVGGTHRS